LDIPTGNVAGNFQNVSLQRILEMFIFCQGKIYCCSAAFIIPDFTFLSIKIVRYFGCLIRHVPFPAIFTKIKSLLATLPTAKLPSATFAISWSLSPT
jgi:hypothetical protein